MLPPIEQSVLQNNPEFAVLYNTLTTNVLNPNGSTKNDPAARERKAVREVRKRKRDAISIYTGLLEDSWLTTLLGSKTTPNKDSETPPPYQRHICRPARRTYKTSS